MNMKTMKKESPSGYLKYVGIPLIILGIAAVVGTFLTSMTARIDIFMSGFRIYFSPLNGIDVLYWIDPHFYILENGFDGFYFAAMVSEIIYNAIFESFVPPLMYYLGVVQIITGIFVVFLGIFALIRYLPLSLSITGIIAGATMILLPVWGILIFENQILDDIITFEIFFDLPMDMIPFLTSSTFPSLGSFIPIIAGAVMVILTGIATAMAGKYRKGKGGFSQMSTIESQAYEPTNLPQTQVNYCPDCGAPITKERQNFCNQCGHRLPL
jgi:hypothetical protein